jgi:putative membrane protein
MNTGVNMNHSTSSLIAVAIAAALAAGSVQAQGGPATPTPATPGGTGADAPGTTSAPGSRTGATGAPSELSSADRRFLLDAASAGMAEVQAGQLAAQKAQDPEVREFAQKMVDAHTASNAELMKLASARNVTPPSEPDRTHRNALDRLRKQSSAEFDRAYMKQQVAEHEKAVSLFEKQAKGGRDPELKDFAAKRLPTLREHLKLARNDMQGLQSSDRSGSPGSSASKATPGAAGMSGPTGMPGGAGSAASGSPPGGTGSR